MACDISKSVSIKHGLRTGYKIRTEDYVGKNGAHCSR